MSLSFWNLLKENVDFFLMNNYPTFCDEIPECIKIDLFLILEIEHIEPIHKCEFRVRIDEFSYFFMVIGKDGS